MGCRAGAGGLGGCCGRRLRRGVHGVHGGRPLQVTESAAQRADLRLPAGLLGRRAGGDLGRCLDRCLSVRGARFRLVLVQALHFLLQDAHRLAERARRGRELLRPEQHDDHQGDDQDLPRAIEQVTYHLRSPQRVVISPATPGQRRTGSSRLFCAAFAIRLWDGRGAGGVRQGTRRAGRSDGDVVEPDSSAGGSYSGPS